MFKKRYKEWLGERESARGESESVTGTWSMLTNWLEEYQSHSLRPRSFSM